MTLDQRAVMWTEWFPRPVTTLSCNVTSTRDTVTEDSSGGLGVKSRSTRPTSDHAGGRCAALSRLPAPWRIVDAGRVGRGRSRLGLAL
ncbi:hypothetical protein NX794_31070 [Streptomyces sp. LP11]|uniref:Uncharacterized protein n=1 Tax=Streptomyces pyxinicus TaxID=2970331 RepID=A0ABT2BB47_9ACTN|nr:hypothetical protein [Streptomyces sp. LP11]MCS0605611.1 hypothetical protein [Streptomyces sp. LP11]